jgi:putative GTP pyrophosphokinase
VTSTSKTQVDQLGERLRRGTVSDEDFRRLDHYRLSFAEAYREVESTIRNTLGLEPTARPAKSTMSIIEKLKRETIRLSQMQDIAGCRLVIEDVFAQNRVVEQLKATLGTVAVIDRRKQPSFGYRAVHIVASARNLAIEIQVRTGLQDLWAQLSERLSDAFDLEIKYGGGGPEFQERLSWFSALIGRAEELELQGEEIAGVRQSIRELLEDDIREVLQFLAELQADDFPH